MIPIFIQTLNHVFEVSKITYIDLKPIGSAIVHFSGEKVSIGQEEIAALLDEMSHLRRSGLLTTAVAPHLPSKGAAL
jgi:hypothetical protein